MKSPTILFILCLFSFNISFTQFDLRDTDPRFELLRWNQDGILLVRLKTQENRIKSLQQKGKSLAAKELEYERRQYHHFLREAFRDNYNFTKVYFFFNRDAYRVLAGDYQDALFDVNGHQVRNPPSNSAVYVLDSYFPNHPHFQHHREEQEGFVVKKVVNTGTAQRISTLTPYVFVAPTHLKKTQDIQRLNKRVLEFNAVLWKRLAMAKAKAAEQQETILVKEN